MAEKEEEHIALSTYLSYIITWQRICEYVNCTSLNDKNKVLVLEDAKERQANVQMGLKIDFTA